MEKKIFNIIAVILLLIAGTSCSAGWLDLEPSDEAGADEAITSYKDADIALNGVYYMIKGTSTYRDYYAATMVYYGDVKADDMQATKASNRTSTAYEARHTATTNVTNMWSIPYRVIYRANRLIQYIDEGAITDAEEKVIANMKGEALMARALAHFDLLRLYSNPYDLAKNGESYGVPIITKVYPYTYKPGRNTINEVYTQIIEDLTYGIEHMNGDNKIGHFNTWAAKGLLARVYLYKGDNANALKLAKDVIENSPYQLWTNDRYVSAWRETPNSQSTTEALFEISITSINDWTDREGIAYLYNENGYADAHITKSFYDFLNTNYVGDVRLNLLKKAEKTGTDATTKGKNVFVNKYAGKSNESDFRIGNVPLIRLSEIYLIGAEAAAKENNQKDAAKYLNKIILRGNPNAKELTDAEVTVDRILEERRVELFGEGHRLFDLLRNDKKVVRFSSIDEQGWHTALVKESQSFDRTYYRAILPIPDSEMSANATLAGQQNPGY